MSLNPLKLIAIVLCLAATPVAAQHAGSINSLRTQDERILRIAEPLLVENVRLCDRTMPRLGAALQSTDQYNEGQQPGFAAPVAFAAVLPGSPAAAAGIGQDDGLLAIGGRTIVKRPELEESPLRDSAFAMLAEQDAFRPLVLEVVRDGARRQISIPIQLECRVLIEVLSGGGSTARSDGRVVQLSYGLVTRASDSEIAVILAHELAHSILRHRDRLSSAGVSKGFAGEFGRDRRLNRQAEVEADRLSVHLLANAGLDPAMAPAFWHTELGRQLGGGLLRSRIYPSPEARAQQLEKEIADYLRGGAPSYPGHLLSRRNRPED